MISKFSTRITTLMFIPRSPLRKNKAEPDKGVVEMNRKALIARLSIGVSFLSLATVTTKPIAYLQGINTSYLPGSLSLRAHQGGKVCRKSSSA